MVELILRIGAVLGLSIAIAIGVGLGLVWVIEFLDNKADARFNRSGSK